MCAANRGSSISGRPSLRSLARDALESRQFALGAADAGDVGALVAEQELGVGPALVFIADAILHRHTYVLEPDLVDLVSAVEQRDRPHGDAGGLFMSINRK